MAAPAEPAPVLGGGMKFRMNLNIIIVIILVVLIIFAAVYMYRRQRDNACVSPPPAIGGKCAEPNVPDSPFAPSRFMPPEYTPSMYMPDFVHAQMMMKPVNVPSKRVVINEIPTEIPAEITPYNDPVTEAPVKKPAELLVKTPAEPLLKKPVETPVKNLIAVPESSDDIVIEPFVSNAGSIHIVDDCQDDPLIIMEIEDDCESIAE